MRDKDDLRFVYTLEVVFPDDEARIVATARPTIRPAPRLELHSEPPFVMPLPGNRALGHPPVVIGSGPGGLAAAYFLALHGYCPLVVERGRAVRDRIHDVHAFDAGGPLDPESNYLFGEGGAGTFSDGKLTCRVTGPDVRRILELFADCKGKPSILYEYRPHLGSNRLPGRRQGPPPAHLAWEAKSVSHAGWKIWTCGTAGCTGCTPLRDSFRHRPRCWPSATALATRMRMLLRARRSHGSQAVSNGPSHRAASGDSQPGRSTVQTLGERLGAADYSLVARGPHDLFTFLHVRGRPYHSQRLGRPATSAPTA